MVTFDERVALDLREGPIGARLDGGLGHDVWPVAEEREGGYSLFVELGRLDAWRMHACGALRGDMLVEIGDLSSSTRPCRGDGHLTNRFYDLVGGGEKDVAARRAEYVAGALLVALVFSDRVGFA